MSEFDRGVFSREAPGDGLSSTAAPSGPSSHLLLSHFQGGETLRQALSIFPQVGVVYLKERALSCTKTKAVQAGCDEGVSVAIGLSQSDQDYPKFLREFFPVKGGRQSPDCGMLSQLYSL